MVCGLRNYCLALHALRIIAYLCHIMKKSIHLLLIAAALFLLPGTSVAQTAPGESNIVDEVAWVVGDEAIFRSDVENYIRSMILGGERLPANAYCLVAEQLAIHKLFLHQASLDSLTISEDILIMAANQKYEEDLSRYGSVESMEEMQKATSSEIKKRYRDIIREQELIKKVQEQLGEAIKVTPADVRNFLNEIPADSLPEIPMRVEVQILMRQPETAQVEIDRVKAELRDYTDRVNEGTPFSTLAILHSEDGSARRGGELGLVVRGALDPSFAAVAWALTDPTKVSKVVQSEFGYHIIQLIEKRGERINVRHILRRPKVSEEAIQADLMKLDSLAGDIRLNKLTFEEAVARVSQDKDTRSNDGLMQNLNSQFMTARFEMDELPAEVAAAVANMSVNEISKPFRMYDKNGNEVCAIVKLRNRIPMHRANMAEDFQLLHNVVLHHHKQEAEMKWIEAKQKTTFVRVNENWKGCEFQYKGWQLQ